MACVPAPLLSRCLLRAIERHSVKLPLRRALFRGSEQHALAALIHARDGRHLPIAARELLLQFAVDAVKIKMPEAGALAGPQETIALAEKLRLALEY